MDKLIEIAPTIEWTQTGPDTYTCEDSRLENEELWQQLLAGFPTLKGYGFRLWKTTGRTMAGDPAGYIIPILTIHERPEPRIENGSLLTPGSAPVSFKYGDVISGSLCYIIALPYSENDGGKLAKKN